MSYYKKIPATHANLQSISEGALVFHLNCGGQIEHRSPPQPTSLTLGSIPSPSWFTGILIADDDDVFACNSCPALWFADEVAQLSQDELDNTFYVQTPEEIWVLTTHPEGYMYLRPATSLEWHSYFFKKG